MAEDRPKDLITYTEARKILGMSTGTLTKLLKNGTLRHWPDPLDARVKLVSRTDVEGCWHRAGGGLHDYYHDRQPERWRRQDNTERIHLKAPRWRGRR